MALLAFSDPATKCGRYQKLYSAQRWDDLIAQFRTDHFALYALSAQSLLSVTLQAGLSALKTPMCSEVRSALARPRPGRAAAGAGPSPAGARASWKPGQWRWFALAPLSRRTMRRTARCAAASWASWPRGCLRRTTHSR